MNMQSRMKPGMVSNWLVTFYKRKDYDNALKYYHKSLEGEDISFYFIEALQKIAKIYELKGNYQKSNEYLKKCIKLYEEITPNMI